eukprot:CAMPEP_0177165452 /NCGR_PEP_ID=MMETSP0367-20130122/7508_1 /TAXON_ID=447022 ORGANISM="Scrippsiella hangoei-like, Strain SHHI-4" /NCGR_SAMPLE_ID=MMETSP0367 /ASSEMBLY_ACC=CAM_ASM_000362 /LENGTH=34 /DNA_ID= /DNA_START= /DNA_END= /DNA_ORIENTATION=
MFNPQEATSNVQGSAYSMSCSGPDGTHAALEAPA